MSHGPRARWLVPGFWVSFVAATLVYAAMVGWSLPRISAGAGGLLPFDMRPAGYSLDEARAFVTALSPEARGFYLSTQHLLDTLYPPLMALTLGLGLWILSPAKTTMAKLLPLGLPVLAMIADLAENALVRDLLAIDPAKLDAGPVMMASAATVVKSLFTGLAMILLLVFAGLWGWRRWSQTG